MKRSLVMGIAIVCCLASSTQAQTVSEAFANSLKEQGFHIVSTRYTWLRRIVVEASNGTFEREILVSRGSEVVLQDLWRPIENDEENFSTQPAGRDPGGVPEDGPAPGPDRGSDHDPAPDPSPDLGRSPAPGPGN